MIKFISEHSGMLFAKTFEHLYISIVALVIAIIVAVPLGILLSFPFLVGTCNYSVIFICIITNFK